MAEDEELSEPDSDYYDESGDDEKVFLQEYLPKRMKLVVNPLKIKIPMLILMLRLMLKSPHKTKMFLKLIFSSFSFSIFCVTGRSQT